MKSRMGRIIVSAAGLVVGFTLLMGTAQFTTHAQSDEGLDRKNYSDKIWQTYNFRFGNDNLSLPGNAAIEGNEFIQPGAFPEGRVLRPLPSRGLPPVAPGVALQLVPHARSTGPASTS